MDITTRGTFPDGSEKRHRLLVEASSPERTTARLRDILQERGELYDRGVPVRIVAGRALECAAAQQMRPASLVHAAHMVCRPYKLIRERDGTVVEVDTRLPLNIATMYLLWQGKWNL